MNESMEFEILSDLSAINPQHIDTNFPAVRDWLERELAPYAGMVVTEDAVSSAKEARAHRVRVCRCPVSVHDCDTFMPLAA